MAPALKNIVDSTFRASPDYELLSFERLAPGEQARLADLREDPDLYGILKPRGGRARNLQSVGQDTALLLLTLQSPGPLPAYVRRRFGEDCNAAVARLVLDGVLEVRVGPAFVGGAEAWPVLHDGPSAEAEGPLGRLSIDALRYGAALGDVTAREVALRLYVFNSLPLTPRWAREVSTVSAFLGLEGGGRVRRRLDASWVSVSEGDQASGWWSWRHRGAVRAPSAEGWTWKLYVSPRMEALPEAFETAVRVFGESRTPVFKVGSTVRDLLRPDKLVAYFADRDDMERVGALLQRALSGLPAHGVPFTSDVAGEALVSFGADPPMDLERGTVPWLRGESWRLHVVHRLAAALLLARRSSDAGAVAPWRFAMDRVRLEGIDPTRWLPLEEGLK